MAIETAVENKNTLLIEAGTGTGKTLGYLVPIVLSGKKALISTGTKTLQDQLFHRDLPSLSQALGQSLSIALLKGRNNYLCLHRLARVSDTPSDLIPDELPILREIEAWAEQTNTGDFADIAVAEGSRVSQLINASGEHCIGHQCDFWSKCHLNQARQRAEAADLVVVNHYLVCADLYMREEQAIKVVPDTDVIVFDEAHQLPKIISDAFSEQITLRMMQRALDDAISSLLSDAAEADALIGELRLVKQVLQNALLKLKPFAGRWSWEACLLQPAITEPIQALYQRWVEITPALKDFESASADIEKLQKRFQRIERQLKRFSNDSQAITASTSISAAEDAEQADATTQHGICWIEVAAKNARLMYTPLNAGKVFSRALSSLAQTPIFTSATLESGGNFAHFRQAVGVFEAQECIIPSPYKLSQQVLRYAFSDLPEPSDPLYAERFLGQLIPLFDATNGRAFVLITSHKDIQRAMRFFDQNPIGQKLLYQGAMPKNELLKAFREDGNAVLVGTQSFWAGVDIKGEALSCVVIAKLPFAPPDDPVLQAKSALLKSQGQNPFMQLQLPEALILFKQGIGRLIRDETDKGILAVADPRVKTKRYGALFLNEISAAPETDDLVRVRYFVQN